ncbi:MAG: hypothetical protein J1F33_05320 [Clostridiales bacterium]|nr:hypothetical protein [Clostridiales bacterium]
MGKHKNNESKLFHIGKGVKYDGYVTPMTGAPNTNLDTYRKSNGTLQRRLKYDNNGNAYVDLDEAHPDYTNDHAHDIENKNRSTVHRDMTKKKCEFDKARKKRRFWKK